MNETPVYSFTVEWFKDEAAQIESYRLNFFTCDNSVEMHDLKRNRLFLRRIRQPEIKLSDLYIGSTQNSWLGTARVTPSGVCNAGKHIANFENNDFKIINLKMINLSNVEVRKHFVEIGECKHIDKLTSVLSNGKLVVIELMRRDAHSTLTNIIYGSGVEEIDIFANSDLLIPTQNPTASAKLAHILFSIPSNPLNQKILDIKDCTCAVIKPHAVQNGLVGVIWEAIKAGGYCIIAAQTFRLSRANASEFLEIYKGVLAEYPELINEFISGSCVALQIIQSGGDFDATREPEDPDSVQQRFREFVGPMDPEIARFLKPDSIRAKYGVDLVRNAIHCTDLPDDVPLEVDYLFRILNG
ncbi:hypothetical protein Aperf_G00000010751 [Anoplocephala perfoliata]